MNFIRCARIIFYGSFVILAQKSHSWNVNKPLLLFIIIIIIIALRFVSFPGLSTVPRETMSLACRELSRALSRTTKKYEFSKFLLCIFTRRFYTIFHALVCRTAVHLFNLGFFQLGTDTWYYAKRCFISLLENMAKHMIMLRDSITLEIIQFLEHCEGEQCRIKLESLTSFSS